MTEELESNPALRALELRVGVWDLHGRDFVKSRPRALHLWVTGRRICSDNDQG